MIVLHNRSESRRAICTRLIAACVLLAALPLQGAAVVPAADRISFGPPDVRGVTRISGAPGAVAGGTYVAVANLDTGHYGLTRSAEDGSFGIDLFATPGGWILVRNDYDRALERSMNVSEALWDPGQAIGLPGTIVQIPNETPGSVPFAVASASFVPLPTWSASGSLDRSSVAAGEPVGIDGTLRVFGSAAGDQSPAADVMVGLVALSRADGSPTVDGAVFCSSVMTPTGLAIERQSRFFGGFPTVAMRATLQADGEQLRGAFSVTLRPPADFPHGYYRPILFVRLRNVANAAPEPNPVSTFLDIGRRGFQDLLGAHLPIVRIGDPAPPAFASTLLANTFAAGARGVDAVEDRGRFGIAPRVGMASERLVVPRHDPRTGATIPYNLEPFVLSMSVGDRPGLMNPPLLPLRLPSGGLTISVRRPDGSTLTLGPLPFRQTIVEPYASPADRIPWENGPHLVSSVKLSTLDPRFEVAFEQYGLHVITLSASVEDVWGTVWTSRGTYEVEVARPLVIDPAVVSGTPFEVGDALQPSARVIPPVRALVEMRYRFAPQSDVARITEKTVMMQANRFGEAHGTAIALDEPGELRVDLAASGRAPDGVLWIGRRTWGNVVAPRNPALIAHGRRGIDTMPEPRPQWFSRKQLGLPVNAGHTFFPFHSGDVMWMANGEEAGITALTFQDPFGTVIGAMRERWNASGNPGMPDGQVDIGEGPLVSLNKSGLDPHIDPSRTDYWSYGYRFVERPLVRVRELVAEDPGPLTYWRFNDRYGKQPGNGAQGDLPNDFKFQFGGLVVRGSALAKPEYAIYGSLFVLVSDDDPLGTRVFPPFEGNGQGPDGGPLFKLKGRDIEMFFHPTGLRPGSIHHRHETASITGYVAPTLPGNVSVVVTSPTGVTRTYNARASRIGYLHDPDHELILNESGVWRANVSVSFDGILPSTNGQIEAPYPSGDVLGSREGEFWFYVVDSHSTQVEVAHGDGLTNGESALPVFLRPADGPAAFAVTPPPGLTNVEMHVTATMPGFILEEKRQTSLTYIYDAPRLAEDYPNLDLHDPGGVADGADTITISFLVSGTDSSGARRHHGRQIVIQGEELQMPDQEPRPKRRAARR